MENRELTMDDYLAMVRRRLKVILVPALLAPLAGFLISYVFPPKYTSQSLVLVQGQEVPDNLVQPVITADFTQRLATMQQQVMAANRLRPMIERLGIAKPGEEGKLIEDVRQSMAIEPVVTDISTAAAQSAVAKSKKKAGGSTTPVPGFNVNYSSRDPRQAQLICDGLTSLLLEENLRTRSKVAQDQVELFHRQVADAKRTLDEQDSKLANFKRQYMGQLPGDAENNLRILMSLNTQLDATSQTLNRAQQDKAYTESLLAQQLSAWKSSKSSTNPQTLDRNPTHSSHNCCSCKRVIRTIIRMSSRPRPTSWRSKRNWRRSITQPPTRPIPPARPVFPNRRRSGSFACSFINTTT